MYTKFVHPVSKTEAAQQVDGSLTFSGCGDRVVPVDGVYDFSGLTCKEDERSHYNEEYQGLESRELANVMSFDKLRGLWNKHTAFGLMYDMTDVGPDKTMLLIGNGVSRKEFSYLEKGASIVYTDLSIDAVSLAKKRFMAAEFYEQFKDKVVFYAIDGLHLPFADESFDVIYGCAFVHHLRDLSPFFDEIKRCLKPGGSCMFFDEAYIGWWQLAKATFLKPVQLFSHWRAGISPEDIYATQRGGYRREEIENLFHGSGFREVFFERRGLFEHLFRRGSSKLLIRGMIDPMAKLGRGIDWLLGERFMRNHGFNLVWGAKK